MPENTRFNYPQTKMTSLNVMFCPNNSSKSKDIQSITMHDKNILIFHIFAKSKYKDLPFVLDENLVK